MARHAIVGNEVSKRYRIGEYRAGYATLRDTIVDVTKRGFRRQVQAHHEEIWALKDVSFEVDEGEVVGFIGRNGAGKSTLLKILTRITPPTSGTATIRGRVGSILEVGTGFHPELTGRENIYLNGSILGMKRREIRAKYDEIVEFSGVQKFIDTPVKRYSTGMYVRLAFAVAAHLEPEVLLIDEVLAVGDHEFQQRCMGRIEDISESGRTVIFVSHDMQAIARLCDRAYWLDGGRVIAEGPSEEIVAQYLQSASGTAVAWQNPKLGQPRRPEEVVRLEAAPGGRPAGRDRRHRRRPRARRDRVPLHRPRARAALPEDQAGDTARRGRLQRLRRRPALGDAYRARVLRQHGLDSRQPPQRGLHDRGRRALLARRAEAPPLRQPAGRALVPCARPGRGRLLEGLLHRAAARRRAAYARVDDGARRRARGYETANRTTGSVASSADA